MMATVFDIQGAQRQDFKTEFEIKCPIPLLEISLANKQWLRCGEFWTETTPKMKFFLEVKSVSIPNETKEFSVEGRLRLVEVDAAGSTEFVLSVEIVWKSGNTSVGNEEPPINRSVFWEERRNRNRPETWVEKITWGFTGFESIKKWASITPLTVAVCLSLIVGVRNAPELPKPLPLLDACDETLSSDLGQLLLGREDKDVAILSADGKEFPAHRLILSVKSPVFDAMFQKDMKEAQEGKIHIKDFSATIIQEFLHYLYTGHLIHEENSIKTHSHELLAIADKYDVGGLKQKSETFLVGNLNVEGALELLCLGDTHHAQTLTTSAIAFIRENIGSFMSGGHISRLARERPHLTDLIFQ